ncbi:uncharacterized protein BO96DRAFT_431589 [Aspergillus niger CBS 101883]|uniref:Uncharacterized protein n=2 Tax=Aspergillus niger TaxID=5061 RepID=A2QIQ0_ASPNC|nr:uncharacterized protein BO96DRAFT_431589 [Aspergillus niger CBS 101883]XP_059600536.1 hypothetical protein An04g04300 [Aspergillus niger]PYH59441.1 hypothetical protein BO96DRAFT_431589 [Aspergillus niger CBS 101883]CAK38694.1 hypothetical protein An04g04300 [Aspergillus niger]
MCPIICHLLPATIDPQTKKSMPQFVAYATALYFSSGGEHALGNLLLIASTRTNDCTLSRSHISTLGHSLISSQWMYSNSRMLTSSTSCTENPAVLGSIFIHITIKLVQSITHRRHNAGQSCVHAA